MPMILQMEHSWSLGQQEELDLLSSNLDPTVICLQETFLKENKNTNFKYFSSYRRYASEVNSIVHGGSSILVKPTTPHRQIKLQTGLQAIAIRATLGKTITVCSIYFPPTVLFNSTDLENLIAQLPPPSYCLGTLTPTVPYGVALKLISQER